MKEQFDVREGKLNALEIEHLVVTHAKDLIPYFVNRCDIKVSNGGSDKFSLPVMNVYSVNSFNGPVRLNHSSHKKNEAQTFPRRGEFGVFALADYDFVIRSPVWPFSIKPQETNLSGLDIEFVNLFGPAEVAHRHAYVNKGLKDFVYMPFGFVQTTEPKGLLYLFEEKGSPLKFMNEHKARKLYSEFSEGLKAEGLRHVVENPANPYKDIYLFGHGQNAKVMASGWSHFKPID